MKNKTKGFTLVEVVVSMSIFLFIIGVAVTIFISIVQTQKKILFEQKIINQISYVQEYMSKALRMAKLDERGDCIKVDDGSENPNKQYIYLLTRPDTGVGFYRGIMFINQSDNETCTEFFLDNATHGDTTTPLVLKELKNSTNINDAVALISTDLEINYFRFAINGVSATISSGLRGASRDQIIQPRISLILSLKIKGGQGEETEKIIQTTISERNLNAQ